MVLDFIKILNAFLSVGETGPRGCPLDWVYGDWAKEDYFLERKFIAPLCMRATDQLKHLHELYFFPNQRLSLASILCQFALKVFLIN